MEWASVKRLGLSCADSSLKIALTVQVGRLILHQPSDRATLTFVMLQGSQETNTSLLGTPALASQGLPTGQRVAAKRRLSITTAPAPEEDEVLC